MTISLDNLNGLTDEEFTTLLSDIFEHSPWVAERAASARPFASVRGLHSAMAEQVKLAGLREQMELICAHPDLAGKAALAGDLTEASKSEQAGAGLDTLDQKEFERFHELNNAYKSKFGFPFILAVRGHDKHSILNAFTERLENDDDVERIEALKQIAEIARYRLEDLVVHTEEKV